MAWTLQATVGGTTYNLSDDNPFSVETPGDAGGPPISRLLDSGPFQDGATDRGYKMGVRTFVLSLLFHASTQSALDGHRDTLRKIFRPRTNTPVALKVTRDDGDVRQLDCYATGEIAIAMPRAQRAAKLHRAVIQLQAADPLWYDPTPGTVTWTASGGSINLTQTVAYNGDYKSYPTITIHGPGSGITVTQMSVPGSPSITLSGSLNASQSRIISLAYGERSVVDNLDANKINEVTSATLLNFPDWYLDGDPAVTGGTNYVYVQVATGASTATYARVVWTNRYLGY